MRRSVVAMDAASGVLLWSASGDGTFVPNSHHTHRYRTWRPTGPMDAKNASSTSRPGIRLRCTQREDRSTVQTFGDGGVVDLKEDFDQDLTRFAQWAGRF